jgi:hypothetical protein
MYNVSEPQTLENTLENVPFDDVAGYAQLVCRLRTERAPDDLPALYLPGLSEGMIASCDLYGLISEYVLQASKPDTLVYYNGNLANDNSTGKSALETGWPGRECYEEELLKRAIPSDLLIPTDPARNTRQECDEFVASAKKLGTTSGGIVSVPYHWEKLLICVIGSMMKYNHVMKIWFMLPKSVNWHLPMVGSQGARKDIRFIDEAGIYIKTFFQYVANGRGDGGKLWIQSWGCSPAQALSYLDWRDGLVKKLEL